MCIHGVRGPGWGVRSALCACVCACEIYSARSPHEIALARTAANDAWGMLTRTPTQDHAGGGGVARNARAQVGVRVDFANLRKGDGRDVWSHMHVAPSPVVKGSCDAGPHDAKEADCVRRCASPGLRAGCSRCAHAEGASFKRAPP